MKRHVAFIIGATLAVGTVAVASASATPRPPRRPPVTGQPIDPNTTTTTPPSHQDQTTTTELPTTTITEADSELQAATARAGVATPVPGNPSCGG